MSKQSLFEKLKQRKWLRKKHSLKDMFLCELYTQYDVNIKALKGYGFPYHITWKAKDGHMKVLRRLSSNRFENPLTNQEYELAGDCHEEGVVVVSKYSMIDWDKSYLLKGYVTNGELIEINEKLKTQKSN